MNAYDLQKLAEKNGYGKYTPIEIVDSEGNVKLLELKNVKFEANSWNGPSIIITLD